MNPNLPPEQNKPERLTLNQLIDGQPNLPAGFQILPRLFALLNDPAADCNALAEIIRIDASLTASVLRVANSVRFAGTARADNVSDAVVRLGFREVYCILLEIVTGSCLKGPPGFRYGPVDLWTHSLATAVSSQVLAEHLTKEDPEFVFSAGLLHDFGKTVLARAAFDQYGAILERCATNNRSVRFAEWELFGTDHAEVGGALLRSWKFPERIATVVASHHRPEAVVREHQVSSALVCVANIIAYRLGMGNGCPPYVTQPDRDALNVVGLALDKIGHYDQEILERLKREQQRL